jgi:large subunit ribosomal protein L31
MVPVHVRELPAHDLREWTTRRPRHLGDTVKNDIHPDYHETSVVCSCGNTFTTRSTAAAGKINADVCSACHPFYTGKQKILDIGGRVDKFEKRFGKKSTVGAAQQ